MEPFFWEGSCHFNESQAVFRPRLIPMSPLVSTLPSVLHIHAPILVQITA